MDARADLRSLVGRRSTRSPGIAHRILEVTDSDVIVATDKSPGREAVPIAEVQAAIDMLERDGEVRIDVKTVGYRSAFVGAVLATVPGAAVRTSPRRVKLDHQ